MANINKMLGVRSDSFFARSVSTSFTFTWSSVHMEKILEGIDPESIITDSDLWLVPTLLESWRGLFRTLGGEELEKLFLYTVTRYGLLYTIQQCKDGFLAYFTEQEEVNQYCPLVTETLKWYTVATAKLVATCLNFLSRVFIGNALEHDYAAECLAAWRSINDTQLREAVKDMACKCPDVFSDENRERVSSKVLALCGFSLDTHRSWRAYTWSPEGKPMEVVTSEKCRHAILRKFVGEELRKALPDEAMRRVKRDVVRDIEGGAIKIPTGSTADTYRDVAESHNALKAAYGNRYTGNEGVDGNGWIPSVDTVVAMHLAKDRHALDKDIYEDILEETFDLMVESIFKHHDPYIRLVDVPKSGTKRRLVAPLSIVAAVFNKCVQQHLYEEVRNNSFRFAHVHINLNDQSVNRWMAQAGSVDNLWATGDLSNASDSIPEFMFREMVEDTLAEDVLCKTHPNIVQYTLDGAVWQTELGSIGISGDPLTFFKMSYFIGAICEVCIRFSITGWKFKSPKGLKLNESEKIANWLVREFEIQSDEISDQTGNWLVKGVLASVYGDDWIIFAPFYPLAVEVFTALGLTVNEAKSYATGGFRESCGGWYYHGVDVTPMFFPRRPIIKNGGGIRNDDATVVNELGDYENSQATMLKAINRLSQWPDAQLPLLKEGLRDATIRRCTIGDDPRDGIHVNYDVSHATSKTPYLVASSAKRVERFIVQNSDGYFAREELDMIDRTSISQGTLKVIGYIWADVVSPEFDPWSGDEPPKELKAWTEMVRKQEGEPYYRGLKDLTPRAFAGEHQVSDAILLCEYLKGGPWYASPLDELLHVSTRRATRAICSTQQPQDKKVVDKKSGDKAAKKPGKGNDKPSKGSNSEKAPDKGASKSKGASPSSKGNSRPAADKDSSPAVLIDKDKTSLKKPNTDSKNTPGKSDT